MLSTLNTCSLALLRTTQGGVSISRMLGQQGSPGVRHTTLRAPVRTFGTARSGLDALDGGEANAMSRISAARTSCKKFIDKPVSKEVLERVFRIVQRVPTSFNTQPYRLVMVSSEQAKNALAPTMMETNRAKVLTAAVTVVVLADLDVQPSRTRDLLKASAPSMEAYADMIPSLLPIFAGSEGKNTTTEWAFKNAGIVGMRLVDAATAHGLATAMLEGIDNEQAMLEVIGAPAARYRVPFVVCVGYPDPEAESGRLSKFAENQSPRFSLEDIISTDSLSTPGIHL